MSLLFEIFDAVRAKPERGIPTLIGDTQRGKTFNVDLYAKHINRAKVTINPQWNPPEDWGGLPIRSGKGRDVVYSQPPAIMSALRVQGLGLDDPFVLFFDEVDKGSRENLDGMLTAFSTLERRVRDTVFHPEVFIVAAMNPPQRPLPEPLLARMLMIPFPYDWNEYIQGLPKDVQAMVRKLYQPDQIKFPERPKSPGSLLTLRHWFDLPAFWENRALQQLVVRGLFPEQMVPGVIEEISTERPVTDPVQWITRATPQAILKGLIPLLDKHTPEEMFKILEAFMNRAKADPTSEIAKLYDTFTAEEKAEPHACVKFNIQLPNGQWTRDIGQDVWEKEYKKALKAKA